MSCVKVTELQVWKWLTIHAFISALSRASFRGSALTATRAKIQHALMGVSTQIYPVYTYSTRPSNTKSCLNKPSCGSEDSGLTAQFSIQKKIELSGLHPCYLCLRKCSTSLLPMSFSFCHQNTALSLSQLKSQFKLVLWHTLIEDSMLGRKNCFQAQLSIDRLCAPPILSPLFATEFIFY